MDTQSRSNSPEGDIDAYITASGGSQLIHSSLAYREGISVHEDVLLGRVWFVARILVAWVTFAVGLISPLTPSDGRPSTMDYVVFIGLPLSFLIWSAFDARSLTARCFVGAQAGAMVYVAASVVSVYV